MFEAKLKEMGIVIPEAPKPLAAYVPAVQVDKFVYTSGQLPIVDGQLKFKGKLGKDITEDEAKQAAKICAINCLSVVKSLIGSLDNIERIVKVVVFVNSSEEFTAQPAIANGASEFFVEVFGDAGKHARSAVGVSQLPLGAPVEIEIIVKLK
ncbi:MAG TPA: RidA family protein [Ignavibacteriales bacterium]|nr:RidA family protein [Ignavibacteriales bacterium]HOL80675.1 RidA family protein [Ignavibacteriales bacterium]HOM64363.1 RidA family protein [Ignavibacteriales bacterium]HPD67151.1 RidA family protein [Ignavibacteriales bacterium]HPP32992.1 RidA family protein [Ignavibacteriales bacterium]